MLSQTKMHLWYQKKTSEPPIPELTPPVNVHIEPEKDENTYVDVDYISEECLTSESTSTLISVNCSERLSFEKSSEEIRKKVSSEDCSKSVSVSDFVDLNYWKEERLCCGTVFRGLHNEVIIDPRLLRACPGRIRKGRKKEKLT
ncbi:unnamed protein product [Phaedon cochleariae]|uniref:Uncharacterized protein n=1 Tax=Phaedon cochleariae TaxID=80249 RepID=A0A9P0DLW8_PHACE|nr:unnamed protein product [Phaedon cochleariae]